MQWSLQLELAGFCRPACPTGSWTCSSFASVPVAVGFSPGWPCLRFCLLPARVARKPAKACLLLAQDKAWASFPGPGPTEQHKNPGAEPKAPVTFSSALADPVPQAPGLPAHSVATCHMEVPGEAGCASSAVMLVFRCLYQGMRGAPNPDDSELPVICFPGPFSGHPT